MLFRLITQHFQTGTIFPKCEQYAYANLSPKCKCSNGLPLWLIWWGIWLQCGRPGFNPWVGKIPWRRERLPTPVFWPGEFHGLYSPWDSKESDMTEWLSLYLKVFDIQFSSVTPVGVTLCNAMDCTPGFPVHHQLPELAQTHVHWVGDAIQPSHPL